jgi:serine phosphatase RsbU (regulator of sigma subunit)
MFILFLYNLFLFFSIRDITFLYYSLFIFFAIHYYCIYIPQGIYLSKCIPWLRNDEWIDHPFQFFLYIAYTFYLFFVRSFLQLKGNSKIMDRFLKFLITYFIFSAVISIHDFQVLRILLTPYPILLGIICVFVISIIAAVKKYKSAGFFLLANVALTTGYVAAILYRFGAINNSFSVYVFAPDQIGFVAFLLLLSFALGDKINILKVEIISAQEKALVVLEEKVQQRTIEVVRQKQEVEKQKSLVEEKNKEVLDSITYAKRLQDAILPPLSIIKKYLPDSFLLYKPKDIVAGDFYWLERAGDNILIAACDCTGHGVPGAMVSVVCSNALNRTVKEFKITEPGKILDKVKELVLETFEKSESDVQDGMDISLCCLNTKTKEIQWSGANNPLWYIQDNELKEVAPDKQPIGKFNLAKPFNTASLKLKKGDTLYLFTDGYADQFGGPKGKKFKYKQLSEKLKAISEKPMEEQKEMLDETIESWKGSLEQVDDILIIGIRV